MTQTNKHSVFVIRIWSFELVSALGVLRKESQGLWRIFLFMFFMSFMVKHRLRQKENDYVTKQTGKVIGKTA